MRSTKSSNGRVHWLVDQGRLKEIGPSSPMFTLTATDTLILATLLVAEYETIKLAAERELAGYSTTNDAYAAQRRLASHKSQEQYQEGATGAEGAELHP